jgi:hypothetical protein
MRIALTTAPDRRAAAIAALTANLEELVGFYAEIRQLEVVGGEYAAADVREFRARVDRLWSRDWATLQAWIAWRPFLRH